MHPPLVKQIVRRRRIIVLVQCQAPQCLLEGEWLKLFLVLSIDLADVKARPRQTFARRVSLFPDRILVLLDHIQHDGGVDLDRTTGSNGISGHQHRLILGLEYVDLPSHVLTGLIRLLPSEGFKVLDEPGMLTDLLDRIALLRIGIKYPLDYVPAVGRNIVRDRVFAFTDLLVELFCVWILEG